MNLLQDQNRPQDIALECAESAKKHEKVEFVVRRNVVPSCV